MPIYDYVCSSCGQRTEVIHGIHDDAPRFCPSCGAEGTLRKGFSTPAILFKGSGWAKKDRAATRIPKSSPSTSSGDSGSSSGDSGSSSGDSGSSSGGSDSGATKADSDSGASAKSNAAGAGGD